jgi:hypothetical protein
MATDRDARALLSRVLATFGAAIVLPACSPRLVDEGDDEAAEDESSESESGSQAESSSTDEGETSGPSESSDAIDDGSEDEDLGGDDTKCFADFGELPEDPCFGAPPQWFEKADIQVPERCLGDWGPDNAYTYCFNPPEGTDCENPPFTAECMAETLPCLDITCGPTTIDGACCYSAVGGCPPGRGFLVAGEPCSATRTSDAGWLQIEQPELDALDPEIRATLADVWASDGMAEHASVASFARFTTQLLALGAPPELVAASVRASADEVRHAKRCFGLASAYANTSIGPGALELRDCLPTGPIELRAVALDLAIEGCIVETVSTLLLAAARDRARDGAVRAVLTELVRDEETHVELAWQALAWMVARGGDELRRALAEVFEHAEFWVRSEPIERAGDPVLLRAHGYLATRERRAIALQVIEQLVLPAARALLSMNEPDFRSEGTIRVQDS